MIGYNLIRIFMLSTFLKVFFLFGGFVESTDPKKDDNLQKMNCYERRQNVTDCICREGHWTSSNNPTQFKYPDAIKKTGILESWGECKIPPHPWVWKVETSCTKKSIPVRAYSPESMCETIRGRNILIVGDSISNEFFHTFLGLAWPSNVPFVKKHTALLDEATLSGDKGNALIVNITCPKVSQNYAISFVRNYYLTTNTDIHKKYLGHSNVELRYYYIYMYIYVYIIYIYIYIYIYMYIYKYTYKYVYIIRSWVNTVVQRKIDIVFMNRGAHYVINDLVLPELKDTFTYLRKKFPKVQTF
jgi:hypothetical protein